MSNQFLPNISDRDRKTFLTAAFAILFFLPSVLLGASEDGAKSSSTSDGLKIYEFVSKTIRPKGDVSQWERYVRGFRRDHNFCFSSGATAGTWHVERFEDIESEDFESSGVFSKFQYSFHIEIYKGFGYFLGSSAGYHYERKVSDRIFIPTSAIMFPGLLVGLVYDINPLFRISTFADYFLERYNDIKKHTPGTEDQAISITAESFDLALNIDYFTYLNFGIRLEGHMRQASLIVPHSNEQGHFPAVKIKRTDRWAGLGLLYHIL